LPNSFSFVTPWIAVNEITHRGVRAGTGDSGDMRNPVSRCGDQEIPKMNSRKELLSSRFLWYRKEKMFTESGLARLTFLFLRDNI